MLALYCISAASSIKQLVSSKNQSRAPLSHRSHAHSCSFVSLRLASVISTWSTGDPPVILAERRFATAVHPRSRTAESHRGEEKGARVEQGAATAGSLHQREQDWHRAHMQAAGWARKPHLALCTYEHCMLVRQRQCSARFCTVCSNRNSGGCMSEPPEHLIFCRGDDWRRQLLSLPLQLVSIHPYRRFPATCASTLVYQHTRQYKAERTSHPASFCPVLPGRLFPALSLLVGCGRGADMLYTYPPLLPIFSFSRHLSISLFQALNDHVRLLLQSTAVGYHTRLYSVLPHHMQQQATASSCGVVFTT